MPHTETMLVACHTGRDGSLDAARQVITLLRESGIRAVVPASDLEAIVGAAPELRGVVEGFVVGGAEEAGLARPQGSDERPLAAAIVLGGDGTMLRTAGLLRGTGAPLLGINFGHVGFLTEGDRTELTEAVRALIAGQFTVEERMTLAIRVSVQGDEVFSTWALNEASIEKASRQKMIEVIIEVDERPLSSFGCDGVLLSTPTGSTAYSFSVGGPVVWPTVEAMLLTPNAAHALFARPLVVARDSSMAVELVRRADTPAVMWCDGQRFFELPPGARIEARRHDDPVRLVRLSNAPFTDRLVTKFDLPTSGWRGPTRA